MVFCFSKMAILETNVALDLAVSRLCRSVVCRGCLLGFKVLGFAGERVQRSARRQLARKVSKKAGLETQEIIPRPGGCF